MILEREGWDDSIEKKGWKQKEKEGKSERNGIDKDMREGQREDGETKRKKEKLREMGLTKRKVRERRKN